MKVDTPAEPKDQLQNESIPLEVINNEKQLLASIYTKGILHKDCQELFHKVRAGYENIILHKYDVVELQEVEYFLWKLHYKHIDEFRKNIKKCSISIGRRKEENVKDGDDAYSIINLHMEGFKSFLSEAMKFYKNLHEAFVKQHCPSKAGIEERCSDLPISLGLEKLKYRYTCHRFLICLGDLARYGELCKKQDAQNWSVAFSYYLEATVTCPESGNPHNQMALLATYVGDAFLALYHCIRSLAVKEPFPDACNNLMLLFEENMSCHFHSLPSEGYCDISKSADIKPLWPISSNSSTDSRSGTSNSEVCVLWPLFVRLTSFFLVKRRLEDFPGTLSSTIKCLEALVQLDDAQLSAALESYELMNPSRKGPYRVLHLVSVLIFILDSLTIDVQRENLKTQLSQQQLRELTKSALVAAFSCMCPLLERCLKSNVQENSPLLPAVLVFVEWLTGAFGRMEQYNVDDKVMRSMACFFNALTALLNQRVLDEGQTACDSTALWEDYELTGFQPTANRQASLDFTNHRERNDSVNSRSSNRCQRIFLAGLKLANSSNSSKQYLLYDNRVKKFCTLASTEVSDTLVLVKGPKGLKSTNAKLQETDSPGKHLIQDSEKCRTVSTEEEEVILFNPLMRHNSAPVHKYDVLIDQISTDRSKEEVGAADERLRRAASMFSGPKHAQLDGPPGFLSDAMKSRHNIPLKQPEVSLKNAATFPAGPPSLNAWVFNSKIGEDRAQLQVNKQSLDPINEIAPEAFACLSIGENKESMADSGHVSTTSMDIPPPYVAHVPSAPLLPDDAFWLADRSSFDQNVPGPRETDGILGAAPMNGRSDALPIRGLTDYSPVLPGLIPGYPPVVGMSSSEWLYHYRNNYNKPEQASSPILSFHTNAPQTVSTSHPNYVSRFDLLNPWGNHLVSTPALYMESPQLLPGSFLGYAADGHRRSNLQLGYQNQYPYVYGGTNEQQPLLYYLKDWQLQKEPQLGGAAFMGN